MWSQPPAWPGASTPPHPLLQSSTFLNLFSLQVKLGEGQVLQQNGEVDPDQMKEVGGPVLPLTPCKHLSVAGTPSQPHHLSRDVDAYVRRRTHVFYPQAGVSASAILTSPPTCRLSPPSSPHLLQAGRNPAQRRPAGPSHLSCQEQRCRHHWAGGLRQWSQRPAPQTAT